MEDYIRELAEIEKLYAYFIKTVFSSAFSSWA